MTRKISVITPVPTALDALCVPFTAGGLRYIGLPTPQCALIPPQPEETGFFTVVSVPPSASPDARWLTRLATQLMDEDDVFQPSFLHGVITQTSLSMTDQLAADWDHALKGLGAAWSKQICGRHPEGLQAGIYLWHQNLMWKVFRLHDDVQGAFMTALHPASSIGNFTPLRIGGTHYQTLSVAVSSRLERFCVEKPELRGLRAIVKDCWRMQGLRNTMENAAFYDVDEPARETSAIIKTLLNAGASIVGMGKLSAFAGREEPSESVDYLLPFNPRGEGYQSPAGSSNGPAVAVASYDWVDIGIGTDTTGSGRRPAFVNGCFGLRPSQDLVSSDGMIPTFKRFDTVSILVRNISLVRDVAKCLTINAPTPQLRPSRLVVPNEFFPVQNIEQMEIIEAFIGDLERSMGVSRELLSIKEMWKHSPPAGVPSMSIDDFLEDVATNTFLYSFYHSFDDFRSRYRKKHARDPFITAFTKWRWNLGRSISIEAHTDAMKRLEIYKDWLLDRVLQHESYNTLVILPIADAQPNYRDDGPGSFFKQNAFDALFMAPILKSPELVVPIGQVPYESRVSESTELLPVAVSVLGNPKSDFALIDTVQRCLEEYGRPSTVSAGRVMFK